MVKKVSKSKKSDKNDTRDQFTVVLEDLRSQFKVFGEGLLGLNEKVYKGFKRMDDKFDEVDIRFIEVNTRLDDHSKILDSHSEMIAQIMMDVTEIKNDLKQKVNRSEFEKLEKRVLMLERRRH